MSSLCFHIVIGNSHMLYVRLLTNDQY